MNYAVVTLVSSSGEEGNGRTYTWQVKEPDFVLLKYGVVWEPDTVVEPFNFIAGEQYEAVVKI